MTLQTPSIHQINLSRVVLKDHKVCKYQQSVDQTGTFDEIYLTGSRPQYRNPMTIQYNIISMNVLYYTTIMRLSENIN